MGLCVDKSETKYCINFEIRRESVVFRFNPIDATCYGDGCIEVSKELLETLSDLLNDPTWRERLLDRVPLAPRNDYQRKIIHGGRLPV